MFHAVDPKNLAQNPFSLIGDQWMLITAGREGAFNTMTASWGGLGVLFHKNVASIYVRPQRYTYEFLEKYEDFSLSFFDPSQRSSLQLLGSQSGRDGDKIAQSGLTPFFPEEAAPYFGEAELVLCCRKLLAQDISPTSFCDEKLHSFFEAKDYHRLYIGEIVQALVRDAEHGA